MSVARVSFHLDDAVRHEPCEHCKEFVLASAYKAVELENASLRALIQLIVDAAQLKWKAESPFAMPEKPT